MRVNGKENTRVRLWDGTHHVTVENNNLNTSSHGHSDNGTAHFHITGLTAGTYNYLIIDLSDTTNYSHDYTSEIHIDWIKYNVASDNNGEYILSWGVLDNVDATNGDLYIVDHIEGSKVAGNSIHNVIPYPAGTGPILTLGKFATGHVSLNDTAFQTDVNLPTSLSPTVAATPPGDGDLILHVPVTAGTIDVIYTVGYHTHSPEHT